MENENNKIPTLNNELYKEEPIIFVTEVIEMGESLRVTIPSKDAKYNNVKKGTPVRVWIKKIEE